MIERCENPNHKDYKNYGKRGIKVCDEWHDVRNYIEWMYSNGYHEDSNLTVDRINVNGNYEPINCRLADAKTQGRNKTTNRMITIDGKTQTLSEWAEELKINRCTLSYRLANGLAIK